MKGWKGNIIVGEAESYSNTGKAYLRAVSQVIRYYKFEGRVAFSFDYEAQKLKKSHAADCPSGYTNVGFQCMKAFPPSIKGQSSMICKGKHQERRGFRCYYESPVRLQPNLPYRFLLLFLFISIIIFFLLKIEIFLKIIIKTQKCIF